jgi:hypothetical protein
MDLHYHPGEYEASSGANMPGCLARRKAVEEKAVEKPHTGACSGRGWWLRFAKSRPARNMNFGIAAGRGCAYRCRNSCSVQSNQRPLRSAQHNHGYSAASEILLVLDILVSGQENVEPGPPRFS